MVFLKITKVLVSEPCESVMSKVYKHWHQLAPCPCKCVSSPIKINKDEFIVISNSEIFRYSIKWNKWKSLIKIPQSFGDIVPSSAGYNQDTNELYIICKTSKILLKINMRICIFDRGKVGIELMLLNRLYLTTDAFVYGSSDLISLNHIANCMGVKGEIHGKHNQINSDPVISLIRLAIGIHD